MALTRAERLARQDHDPGDPDDDVYVNIKTGRSRAHIYHRTLDCTRITAPDNYKKRSRAAAQRAWKAPCWKCVIPDDAPTGGYPDDYSDAAPSGSDS